MCVAGAPCNNSYNESVEGLCNSKCNRQELWLLLGFAAFGFRIQTAGSRGEDAAKNPRAIFVSSSVTSLSTTSCGCQLLGKCNVLKIDSPKFGYKYITEIKNEKHISVSLVSFV